MRAISWKPLAMEVETSVPAMYRNLAALDADADRLVGRVQRGGTFYEGAKSS
jgi:hypothetical protein